MASQGAWVPDCNSPQRPQCPKSGVEGESLLWGLPGKALVISCGQAWKVSQRFFNRELESSIITSQNVNPARKWQGEVPQHEGSQCVSYQLSTHSCKCTLKIRSMTREGTSLGISPVKGHFSYKGTVLACFWHRGGRGAAVWAWGHSMEPAPTLDPEYDPHLTLFQPQSGDNLSVALLKMETRGLLQSPHSCLWPGGSRTKQLFPL